jgi:hypothetical protein
MASKVHFAFFREGVSDEDLLPHLRTLLVKAGAAEAVGTVRTYPGPTADKFRRLLAEEGSVDLVFVHRDSDSAGSDARRTEIFSAAEAAGFSSPVVPVVPVRMIEAWLLLSETEIRRVVGKPNGRKPLGLPALHEIERRADPKDILAGALLAASETTGQRHRDEKKEFSKRRKVLLDRLDIDGPIVNLPAWQRLLEDIGRAVALLS